MCGFFVYRKMCTELPEIVINLIRRSVNGITDTAPKTNPLTTVGVTRTHTGARNPIRIRIRQN